MSEWIAPPVLALQFLTAVPVPLTVPAAPMHLGRSLAFFPVVGVLLGLALAALDRALLLVLPVPVATALLLTAATALTGALHLDGLMDTCDGVFGGRTPERRLEIMRDSRVGSYGALAGTLQLLLKYAALVSLPIEWRWIGLVLALTCGRWTMAAATWVFPYARAEGLGTAFKAGVTRPAIGAAAVLALAIAWVASHGLGVGLLVGATSVAWLVARYLCGKLGGLTGDCYGALNEVVESTVLVGLVAMLALGAPWLGRPDAVISR